ncbi:MAG: Flp pilus assembly complex ATPase component TadA [Candidatus Omnitrophica bacterium]|nr:Flp pilus assembly complex ATPase component TadA [Candidatus Omnitrophota bacterium]
MDNKSLKLGQILLGEGILDKQQLQDLLDSQKTDPRPLGEIIIQKGLVDDNRLTEVLAKMFQIPYVDLRQTKIDSTLIGLIPTDLLQVHRVLPIKLEDQKLTVATNNPLDVNVLQDLQIRTGYTIIPIMSSIKDIDQNLQEYFDSINTGVKMSSSKKDDNEARVMQYIDAIIRRAIREKTSDIHFEPLKESMRVRFRIDGVLYEKDTIGKDLQRNCISRIKIISGMDLTETRRPQDGRCSFTVGMGQYDLRVSTLPNINGESLVMRILTKSFIKQSFSTLGMSPSMIKDLESLVEKPYGLILVTGPTGAGKTTTLYAMLGQLNDSERSIITVEDPVEYELEGICQTPTNTAIGYTFANAIRHILRHDPDVIMIGEIRDRETAEIAIRSALTGHLVLSTMHTNTAAGAVTRLLEMEIEPFLISSALNGVISQRLVRGLCTSCKEIYTPEPEIVNRIRQYVPLEDGAKLARPIGCDACLTTGFRGRSPIFEILKVDETIRHLIIKSADESVISETAVKNGMKLLGVAGLEKVVNQSTEFSETMRNVFID